MAKKKDNFLEGIKDAFSEENDPKRLTDADLEIAKDAYGTTDALSVYASILQDEKEIIEALAKKAAPELKQLFRNRLYAEMENSKTSEVLAFINSADSASIRSLMGI